MKGSKVDHEKDDRVPTMDTEAGATESGHQRLE